MNPEIESQTSNLSPHAIERTRGELARSERECQGVRTYEIFKLGYVILRYRVMKQLLFWARVSPTRGNVVDPCDACDRELPSNSLGSDG